MCPFAAKLADSAKAFSINLALSLAAVALFLVLGEAALWTVAPPPKPGLPTGMFIHHDNLWQLRPGYAGEMDNRVDFHGKPVNANARGQRVVPAAPAQAGRALYAIGDSQTFGHGLSDEESWPNRLQEALNQRGQSVRVENLGVPAINIDQYLVRMQKLTPRLQPGDMVVVGLSWNDLITPLPKGELPSLKVVEGHLVNAASGDDEESQRRRIRLYESTGIYLPPLQDVKSALDALAGHSALVNLLYPRAKAIYYRLRSDRPIDHLVAMGVPAANMDQLARMARAAASRGAKFTVVLFPDKFLFEDEAWRVFSVNGRDYPARNLMAHLGLPHCARLGMRCLDAFPLLHAHQFDPVAFGADGHYNEQGATLIGRWLAGMVVDDLGS